MKPFVLGVAGGTGAGKSTLAYGLEDAFPHQVTVIHLDDYFRPAKEVPRHFDMTAWDDPSALDVSKLVSDLEQLKGGSPTIILTKSARLNSDFPLTKKKIAVKHVPKPLIVVDGWLLLWFENLRRILDFSVYTGCTPCSPYVTA